MKAMQCKSNAVGRLNKGNILWSASICWSGCFNSSRH